MSILDKAILQILLDEARKAREHAFVIRSQHKIGAACLMRSGEVFAGCTVEGIISGLGACAERVALDHAIVHGHYQVKALLVLDDRPVFPCGACLQYLKQFAQIDDADPEVIAADIDGNMLYKKLSLLLPNGYASTNRRDSFALYRKI